MTIQNDEEYETVLGRITKAVEFISNPLTSSADKQRYMQKYNELVEDARAYRRIECHGYDYVLEGLRDVQKPPKETYLPPPLINPPTEQEAENLSKSEVTRGLSAFLDED